jgi:hypothetical protein
MLSGQDANGARVRWAEPNGQGKKMGAKEAFSSTGVESRARKDFWYAEGEVTMGDSLKTNLLHSNEDYRNRRLCILKV